MKISINKNWSSFIPNLHSRSYILKYHTKNVPVNIAVSYDR